jgi:hypothetical protein
MTHPFQRDAPNWPNCTIINSYKSPTEMEMLKVRHRHFIQQRGGVYEDPFSKADVEEMRKEKEMHQKIMEERLAANADAPVAPAASTPSAGGLFVDNRSCCRWIVWINASFFRGIVWIQGSGSIDWWIVWIVSRSDSWWIVWIDPW